MARTYASMSTAELIDEIGRLQSQADKLREDWPCFVRTQHEPLLARMRTVLARRETEKV